MYKFFIYIPFLFTTLFLGAQDPLYNPYVNNASINPAPLESGGKGVLSFTFGNSGSDSLTVITGSRMSIDISLSNGVPDNSDPLQAIGGAFSGLFTWEFKGGIYKGTQSDTILPKSSGSITIDYRATSNSTQSDPRNGFRAVVNPGPYQSANLSQDDQLTLYTWTSCAAVNPPSVGTITQPTCTQPGSVVLSALPSSGTWTLTRSPGGVTITGTGTSTTITGLNTGTYTFTVTNADGCTSPSSQDIVINEQPVIPSAPVIGTITQPTCQTGTGSVSLSGLPSSGTWTLTRNPGAITTSGTGASTTISSLSPGTYTFTVTLAGCTSASSQNALVNEQPGAPSAPVIGTITQPTCQTGTGSVSLSGLPSSGTWTLTRNPGAITTSGTGASTTISSLAPGTYTFTVTLAGCTSASSQNAVVNEQPGDPSAPVIGTITQPTCQRSTGSVSLSGLPSSGTWTLTRNPGAITTSGTGASTTVSSLAPGTYTFTVTLAGCTSASSQNAVVNEQPGAPSAPVIGTITQPTCQTGTGSVTLSGLPSSGTWTLTRNPGAITTSGTGASTTVSSLSPGTYTFTVTLAGCTSASSQDAVVSAPAGIPAPAIGTITQPTCDQLTGSVVLTGLPAGTWVLTRNPGGFKIEGSGLSYTNSDLTKGTYTYSVTNNEGCTSASSSNVVINDPPLIPVSPSQRINCLFGSGHAIVTVLNPVATGMEYRLDNGNFQSSNIFLDVNNGSHTISVRSAAGCTTTGSPFSVSCGCVNGPTINLSSRSGVACGITPLTVSGNIFANATSVTITEDGAGSVFPTIISVSPFTFTYTPAAADAGNTVTITFTTNNPAGEPCRPAVTTYTLTTSGVPAAPSAGTITHPTCTSSTGSIVLGGLPTGNWTITRSPGGVSTQGSGQTSTISGLAGGSYTFTVTNANGCTSPSSSAVVINAQPAIPETPIAGTIVHPTCSIGTGSVQLTGLPSTGTWTLVRYPGTVSSSGTGATTTIAGLISGTYNFTVTGQGGCTSVLSGNIVINAQPPTPNAPVVGIITAPTCLSPGRVVLNGLPSGGAWTLNSIPAGITLTGTGTSATVSNLSTGMYNFIVTNSSGCISQQSAGVAIPAVPNAPEIIITDPAPVCTPATVDITAAAITAGSTAGLTYTYWTNIAATVAYTTPAVATNGIYYIKGTNSALCSTIKPVIVTIKERPTAIAGPDQVLNYVFDAQVTGNEPAPGETGLWSVSKGSGIFTNPGSASTTINGLALGRNVLMWTLNNQICLPSFDTLSIVVNDLIVPTLITPNDDGRNDFFILEGLEEQSHNELTIFDRRGVLVYKNKDYKNEWDGVDYNGRHLPDDTYFFVIRTGKGQSKAGYVIIRK